MTIPESKIKKMFSLYLQGYSENFIARKLKISRASVNHKTKAYCKKMGIDTNTLDFNVQAKLIYLYFYEGRKNDNQG